MTTLSSQQRGWIEASVPMMIGVAHRMVSVFRALTVDDMQGPGHDGLVKAAFRFDPTKGKPFGGFAFPRVRGEMLNEAARLLKTPMTVLRKMAGIDVATEPSEDDAETADDVMKEAELEPREYTTRYLESKAALYAGAVLLNPPGPAHAEEELIARETRARGIAAVRAVLESLSAQDRACVQAVMYEEKTLEETGAELGISEKTVYRSIQRAKEALRKALRKAGLDGRA